MLFEDTSSFPFIPEIVLRDLKLEEHLTIMKYYKA